MPLRKLAAQHLGFLLAYWAAGFLAWLLFTGTLASWELLLGAASSLLGAIGTEAARSAGVVRFRPRLSWIVQAWRLPWYAVRDSFQVLWIAATSTFRPRPSILRSVVFDGGGADAAAQARRALAVTYSTVPANTIVLEIDAAKEVMVLHQIAPAPTSRVARRLGARS